MSIFSKLKQAIGGKSSQNAELEALRSDRRLHTRFNITVQSVARLVLPNGATASVLDISYGGAACRFPAGAVLSAHMPARLFMLGNSVEVIFSPVRDPSQARDGHVMVGIHILHQKPDSLLFLRDVIEPLRTGLTVTTIPTDMRKDMYRSAEWECLRGEGPIDFIAKLADGQVVEALLTFAVDGAYAEVIFKHGAIVTGRSTGGSATMSVGTNMAQTVTVDDQIARRAALIMMGMPTQHTTLIQPVLDATLATLTKSGHVVAA